MSVICETNDGQKALYDVRGNEVIPPGDYDNLFLSPRHSEVMFVLYEQNGLEGAFDLNGNKLTRPCADIVDVYKDRV